MKPITRRGFTLIELLVVVAIIALLLSILVPALARARTVARRGQAAAHLNVISTALHAFANDMGDFPNSDAFAEGVPPGNDPNYYPVIAPTGAHMLALALVGTPLGNMPLGNKKPYLSADKAGAIRDDQDVEWWGMFPYRVANSVKYGQWGAYVLRDLAFGSPILYYKANRRAKYAMTNPASYYCTGVRRDPSNPSVQAAYYLSDNGMITGCPTGFVPFGAGDQFLGWGPGMPMLLRYPPGGPMNDGPKAAAWFAHYTEIENTRVPDAVPSLYQYEPLTARAQNSEEFLLISAGPDGIFGPTGTGANKCDDIANFTVPTTGP